MICEATEVGLESSMGENDWLEIKGAGDFINEFCKLTGEFMGEIVGDFLICPIDESVFTLEPIA